MLTTTIRADSGWQIGPACLQATPLYEVPFPPAAPIQERQNTYAKVRQLRNYKPYSVDSPIIIVSFSGQFRETAWRKMSVWLVEPV